MKRIIHHDTYISIGFLLFSVFMFIVSLSIPETILLIFSNLLGLMILFSGITVYQSLKSSKSIVDGNVEDTQYLKADILKMPIISVLFILGYCVCINLLGYFVSTTLFLLGFMYYCGVRNFKKLVTIIIVTNIFMYLILVQQLDVQFPKGIIF